jgi:hypothetical protein
LTDWLPEGVEQEAPKPLPTRTIDWSQVKPVRWLWEQRIPVGKLSLLVAEEGGGKGTLAAWLATAVMRGDLYGDINESQRVMIVGDEDGLEDTWVPRLIAAGATRAQLEQLVVVPAQEIQLYQADHVRMLQTTIEQESIGWVLFDQALDHIDGGKDGAGIYNPKHIRDALRPLRYVARDADVAVTAFLHPIKGTPKNFRELVGGSHQFNAVARASLWLGPDPDSEDPADRILVRGKGNLSAEPPSFEFRIESREFELEGVDWNQPAVAGARYGERYRRDLEGGNGYGFGQRASRSTHELALAATLVQMQQAGDPQTITQLAEATGVARNTMTKTLELMREQGLVSRIGERGPWKLVDQPKLD